jgi:serine/threonine protein kinase
MMVMQYFPYGNMKNNYHENLYNKLKLFIQIVKGLKAIHSKEFIHKDLHSGNILSYDHYAYRITDLGLCRPVNEQNDEKKIYGILPYVAPKVRKFSQCFIILLVLHVQLQSKNTGWVMPSIFPNHFFLYFNVRNALPSSEKEYNKSGDCRLRFLKLWPSQGACSNMDYPTTRLSKQRLPHV